MKSEEIMYTIIIVFVRSIRDNSGYEIVIKSQKIAIENSNPDYPLIMFNDLEYCPKGTYSKNGKQGFYYYVESIKK